MPNLMRVLLRRPIGKPGPSGGHVLRGGISSAPKETLRVPVPTMRPGLPRSTTGNRPTPRSSILVRAAHSGSSGKATTRSVLPASATVISSPRSCRNARTMSPRVMMPASRFWSSTIKVPCHRHQHNPKPQMMTLRRRRCSRKAAIESEVCDRGNEPDQSVSDQRADRPDPHRHGGQQEYAAVGAEIPQFILRGCARHDRFVIMDRLGQWFCLNQHSAYYVV